jgi:hypothetical protein
VGWGPVPDLAAPWRLLEIAFLIEKHIFTFQSSWPGFEPVSEIWPRNKKKSLKLTKAEKKKKKLSKILLRVGADRISLKLVWKPGPSLNHPRSWFSLTISFDPRWLQENRGIGDTYEASCAMFQLKSLQSIRIVNDLVFLHKSLRHHLLDSDRFHEKFFWSDKQKPRILLRRMWTKSSSE